MTDDAKRSRIITFYSYKGGTGRSMALANMAWLLALAGHKVLAIDWDLEAPGLHRYFHPFLSDPELTSSDGVIDFFHRFIEEASARSVAAPEYGSERAAGETVASPPDVSPTPWYVPVANINQLANAIDYPFPDEGLLDFIPAGRQGPMYAGRVNSFNWKHFYDRLDGWAVIDEMCRQLRGEYEFILVDSRTGVADTAGICTVQMPDQVVVCFTLNYQSVHGASSAAKSILEQRKGDVRVFPVPMRVDLQEKLKQEAVEVYAKGLFLDLMNDLDATAGAAREQYWADVQVPHISFYAFEEHLAWFPDPPIQVTGMLASIKRLTAYVASRKALDLPGPDSAERIEALRHYGGIWADRASAVEERASRQAPAPAAVKEAPKPNVYVSASSADRDAARAIGLLLRSQVEIGLAMSDDGTPESIRRALGESRGALITFGSLGIEPSQLRELALVRAHQREETRHGRVFPIVPVLLPRTHLEPPAALLAIYRPIEFREGRPDDRSIEALAARIDNRSMDQSDSQYSPFPGLHPFGELDACAYFGRDLAVELLRQRVHSNRIVVVEGPRGAGKTSLVFSGLLPALRRQSAPDPSWTIAIQTSRATPDRVLGTLIPPAASSRDAAEPARSLVVVDDVHPARLRLLIQSASTSPPGQRTFLFIVNNPDSPFIINAPESASPQARLEVPVLSDSDRRSAVEGPAAAAGLSVEPALLDRIVDESAAAPLPALSLGLQILWARRRGAVLTIEGWHEIGPLATAIDRWADAALGRVPQALRRDAELLLIRLSLLVDDPNQPDVIALASLDEAIRSAANELREAELVTIAATRDEHAGFVRLTHPILVSHWTRLSGWLERDRPFYAWRQRIARPLAQWQASDAPLLLLRERDLEEGRRWQLERADELTEAERRFVASSERRDIESRLAKDALPRRQRRAQTIVASVMVLFVVVIGTIVAVVRSGNRQSELVREAAQQQINQGRFDDAVAILDRAPQVLERDWQAQALKAYASFRAADFAAAVDAYKSAINLNPGNVDLRKGVANAFKLQGNLAEALKEYDVILSRGEVDVQTLKDRAFARRTLGNVTGAIEDYQAVLRADQNDRQTQEDLAYAKRLATAY